MYVRYNSPRGVLFFFIRKIGVLFKGCQLILETGNNFREAIRKSVHRGNLKHVSAPANPMPFQILQPDSTISV